MLSLLHRERNQTIRFCNMLSIENGMLQFFGRPTKKKSMLYDVAKML